MWQQFDEAVQRFEELERQLGDPAVIGNRERYTQAAKEHGALSKLVKPYRDYQRLSEDIRAAEAVLAAESDAEMRAYAEQELAELRRREQTLKSRLEDLLLVEPGEDFASVIMEIRGKA